MSQDKFTPLLPLMREKAQFFRKSYIETANQAFSRSLDGSLIHPGEYGGYRERLLEALLRSFLPNYAGTGTGFAIDRSGETSTQIDIIIYDSEELPRIEDPSLRRFFPIEGILAAGEVKSHVAAGQLNDYLDKLMKIKSMTTKPPATLTPVRPSWRVNEVVTLKQRLDSEDGIKARREVIEAVLSENYDPCENNWQNKITFLVCSEFEGGATELRKALNKQIGAVKSEREAAMNHNMFLSLNDGYQTYTIGERAHPYPRGWSDNLQVNYRGTMSFVPADNHCNHILAFVSDLCSAVSDTAVYPFRVEDYVDITREYIRW